MTKTGRFWTKVDALEESGFDRDTAILLVKTDETLAKCQGNPAFQAGYAKWRAERGRA